MKNIKSAPSASEAPNTKYPSHAASYNWGDVHKFGDSKGCPGITLSISCTLNPCTLPLTAGPPHWRLYRLWYWPSFPTSPCTVSTTSANARPTHNTQIRKRVDKVAPFISGCKLMQRGVYTPTPPNRRTPRRRPSCACSLLWRPKYVRHIFRHVRMLSACPDCVVPLENANLHIDNFVQPIWW